VETLSTFPLTLACADKVSSGEALGSLPDVAAISERLQMGFPLRMETRMKNGNLPLRSSYTEKEAAQALGISLTRLQLLLDENIFNDGGRRPPEVARSAAAGTHATICAHYADELLTRAHYCDVCGAASSQAFAKPRVNFFL